MPAIGKVPSTKNQVSDNFQRAKAPENMRMFDDQPEGVSILLGVLNLDLPWDLHLVRHNALDGSVLWRITWDFSGSGVSPFEKFYEKPLKKFKILSFCPLIIATKGDIMINNMVLSREIEWIGYEHKRNMLQVEFIVGSIYQYENVPETVYKEFLTAPSHGRYFESNIKNKYQTRKIR